MQAYHLRTEEPGRCTVGAIIGTDTMPLDSLLIYEADLLLGYAPDGKRKGDIRKYSKECIGRAVKITLNDPSVEGEVISKIEPHQNVVDILSKIYSMPVENGLFRVEKRMTLDWDYQGTTKELIHILTEGRVEHKDQGKRRRRLRDFIPRIRIPIPAPAY